MHSTVSDRSRPTGSLSSDTTTRPNSMWPQKDDDDDESSSSSSASSFRHWGSSDANHPVAIESPDEQKLPRIHPGPNQNYGQQPSSAETGISLPPIDRVSLNNATTRPDDVKWFLGEASTTDDAPSLFAVGLKQIPQAPDARRKQMNPRGAIFAKPSMPLQENSFDNEDLGPTLLRHSVEIHEHFDDSEFEKRSLEMPGTDTAAREKLVCKPPLKPVCGAATSRPNYKFSGEFSDLVSSEVNGTLGSVRSVPHSQLPSHAQNYEVGVVKQPRCSKDLEAKIFLLEKQINEFRENYDQYSRNMSEDHALEDVCQEIESEIISAENLITALKCQIYKKNERNNIPQDRLEYGFGIAYTNVSKQCEQVSQLYKKCKVWINKKNEQLENSQAILKIFPSEKRLELPTPERLAYINSKITRVNVNENHFIAHNRIVDLEIKMKELMRNLENLRNECREYDKFHNIRSWLAEITENVTTAESYVSAERGFFSGEYDDIDPEFNLFLALEGKATAADAGIANAKTVYENALACFKSKKDVITAQINLLKSKATT